MSASPHTSLSRILVGCVLVVGGAILSESCLTPDFTFSDVDGEGFFPSHCENSRRDDEKGETDIDCGGPCPPCPIGSGCVIARGCEAPPEDDPSVVECVDDVCRLDCPPDRADCNSRASDGCEAALLSDVDHCGACDNECDPEHAVGQCLSGTCRIKTDEEGQGCELGYANCNLDDKDGCEANLQTDAEHCGACEEAVCSDAGGLPSCQAGECAIECEDGQEDCDENAVANGCEVNTAKSVTHCGKCNNECPTSGDGWSAFCKDGSCGETECPEGMGDCDGDQECLDDLDTITNCGACGQGCSVSHGTPSCEDEACSIQACDSSDEAIWEDCDNSYLTGCEVDTQSSPTSCGGCLTAEGGIGQDCSEKEGAEQVTVAGCAAGECAVLSCETGYADCDAEFDTGCEINTEDDELNCGGCADQGGDLCTSKAHSTTACSGGRCEYLCDNGWVDLNVDRYDETSDGCETRQVTVVGAGVWGALDTGGTANGNLIIDHTLVRAAGSLRAILVAVMCRGPSANDCLLSTALYAGTGLRRLGQVFLTDSSAELYYLMDSELPAPGNYQVQLNRNDQWGSLSAEVIELNGVNQQATFADTQSVVTSASCETGVDGSLVLSMPPGALAYAFGGGNADSAEPSADTSILAPLTLSQNRAANYLVFGSAVGRLSGEQVTATFDFASCLRSVAYGVAVRAAPN